MDACVSGIRMPASLLDQAVSRDRKRKARIRLTGAAGTTAAIAAMAAAAVVIATVPGRPSGRPAAGPAAGWAAGAGRRLRAQPGRGRTGELVSHDQRGR
jgi:hypothetical protein